MSRAWPRRCARRIGTTQTRSAAMLEGLDQLLKDSGQPGLAELRQLLADLLGGPDATGRLVEQVPLKTQPVRVYRVRFVQNGSVRSWVVKRLEPGLGKRNEL